MGKTVKIANPIYDVVFKYLLEDKRVAKLLLSALLELEVVDVELKPQEISADIDAPKNFTVYRIDFKARIRDKEGKEQIVLIELQKAKLATDIMRFRRYLGLQYSHPDNIVEVEEKDEYGNLRVKKYALPIITIYFLGYPLEDDFKDVPVIRVARKLIDQSSKEVLKGKSYFIESLTHDSIVVQIGAIKNKERRNKLEKILSIFEQGKIHEVDINESDYPEEYRPIIRRLKEALADPEVREVMIVEDEILDELAEREREVELTAKLLKEAQEKIEQERIRAEQERKRAEQERKEKEEAKRREAEAKRREAEAKKKLLESARLMKESGLSIDLIIQATGLTREEIEKL